MNASFLSVGLSVKRTASYRRWFCFLPLSAALLFGGAIDHARAQTYQSWRGENTQGNLLNSTAWWQGSANTMVFGQQEFDNNVQTTMTNNNDGNVFSTWRWVFKGGASSARTITGNGLRFFDFSGNDGGIYNESSATHVFNVAIEGDGTDDPFQIHLNSTGGLTFGSTVNNQGTTIEILGTASGAKTVTFSGVVSGSGGMFVNNANATVLFDAANTYSGQLTINAGTVRLGGTGDTFGASTQAIRVGTGATLDLNGVSTTVGSVGEEGFADGGTITLGGGTLTIGGTATTSQNSISGTGGITHTGSGSIALYGTQSYTGTTSVSAGTVATSSAMSSSSYNITGTGTFSTSTANLISDTATVTLADTGSLSLGGNEALGALSGNGGTVALGAHVLTTSSSANTSFAGGFSGTGAVVKQGTGSLTLSGANTTTGGLFIDNGAINLNGGSMLFSGIDIGGGINGNAQSGNDAALNVTSGSFSQAITVNAETNSAGLSGTRTIEFANTTGSATLSGTVALEKTVSAVVGTSAATGVLSGVISGAGGLTKTGAGTLTLSGSAANTYTGLTTVSGGVLELNKSSGNAIVGNVTVNSGAVLLLSASNQVDSGAGDTVTLSGGTITRASGVTEIFGNLNVTTASTINFSGGTGNVIEFSGLTGGYTPSSLRALQLFNFTQGNSLIIRNTSNWASEINSGFTFDGLGGFGGSTFVDNGGGIGTFTITAIPEPSTYLAAAGLLAMFLWPVRRRLIKDAKSILGLRPTGRDRIEAYRNA